jgi:pimeloyl-ACP methyl ester carboxylesterase
MKSRMRSSGRRPWLSAGLPIAAVLAMAVVVTAASGAGSTAVMHGAARTKPKVAPSTAPPRHLIYLHGRIVQLEQSRRPQHPQFGYYELDAILDAFRSRGFVVSADLRPQDATVADSAEKVAAQVRALVQSGVPADRITVVGASMGAAIALRAAALVRDADLRIAVLGACLSASLPGVATDTGATPIGWLLSIRETSDELTEPCEQWKPAPGSASSPTVREMLLDTGLHHGFLFRPLPEWVDPVATWATTAHAPR